MKLDPARARRVALSLMLVREMQDDSTCEACDDPIFDDQAAFAVESPHVICRCCARCASYPLDRVCGASATPADVSVWLVRAGRAAGSATALELGT